MSLATFLSTRIASPNFGIPFPDPSVGFYGGQLTSKGLCLIVKFPSYLISTSIFGLFPKFGERSVRCPCSSPHTLELGKVLRCDTLWGLFGILIILLPIKLYFELSTINAKRKKLGLKEQKPYKLIVKTSLKSKAKLFKSIPLKSVVSGEPYEITFYFQNIAEETFPGANFNFDIQWPSQQFDSGTIKVPPLNKNDAHNSSSTTFTALSDGSSLVFIRVNPYHMGEYHIKNEKNELRTVQFYKGKRVEDRIKSSASISLINSKTSEEIYEFWALVIAMFSLFIIALEKVISIWNWFMF